MRSINIMDCEYEDLDRAANALGESIDWVLVLLVQGYLSDLLEEYDLDPDEVLSQEV